MKLRDDLFSVLDLGWECTRRAWRLLSAEQGVLSTPEDVVSTGRDLDQLAYDLRRLGHGKPARLAFSVAFVLNGLAGQTIQFDRELGDKTSQIVVILAEMLLELEATSHITVEEPAELVDDLRNRWGLVLYADDHSAAGPPRPHFRQLADQTSSATEAARAETLAVVDELMLASESLLNLATRDCEFPYTVAVSRIHHLCATLKDRVLARAPQRPQIGLRDRAAASNCSPAAEGPFPEIATMLPIGDAVAAIPESRGTSETQRPDRVPRVLVIDDSAFFRMLLTSAMESSGYAARAVATAADAQATLDDRDWDLVICAAAEFSTPSGPSEWLSNRMAEWKSRLIVLTDEPNSTGLPVAEDHRVRRTDLSALLAQVKSILGTVAPVRLSA